MLRLASSAQLLTSKSLSKKCRLASDALLSKKHQHFQAVTRDGASCLISMQNHVLPQIVTQGIFSYELLASERN